MAFPGERFTVDFDSDDDQQSPNHSDLAPSSLIGEIHEHSPAAAPAPPAPKAPSTTGFPAHRRRAKKPSAFKQRRANPPSPPSTSTPEPSSEKSAIDEENRRQLSSMTEAELQREREELIESMDQGLLERFLRRARIDSSGDDSGVPSKAQPAPEPKPEHSTEKEQPTSSTPTTLPPSERNTKPIRDDLPPSHPPSDLHPAAEYTPPSTMHFPAPPQPESSSPMPNLDPSSPSFLANLQTHYFPNISHDPSSLSWLQPPSADADSPDANSAYHPASDSEAVHASAIRFSLLGTLLSPKTSLALPTTLGLHHHGNDPHAAGYTIPELAILSRSSFPAQRCIAWQVLGRILYRLGKGQFGERGSTLVEGLWFVIEHEGVVAGMLAEADSGSLSSSSRRADDKNRAGDQSQDKKTLKGDLGAAGQQSGIGRHASAAAWAVEGTWLWQISGAGDRGVLKEGTVRSQ